MYTVKPVNKGQPKERQKMVFTDKWSLFGGYFLLVLPYKGRSIKMWPLKITGCVYLGTAFNTGLTVYLDTE